MLGSPITPCKWLFLVLRRLDRTGKAPQPSKSGCLREQTAQILLKKPHLSAVNLRQALLFWYFSIQGFYHSSRSGTLPSFSQLVLYFCKPFSFCLWLTLFLTFECQILLSHFALLCINFPTITALIPANCIWLIWCHLYVQSKYFKFSKTACLKIQLKVFQNWRSPILSNFLVILIRQRASCGGRRPIQPT